MVVWVTMGEISSSRSLGGGGFFEIELFPERLMLGQNLLVWLDAVNYGDLYTQNRFGIPESVLMKSISRP